MSGPVVFFALLSCVQVVIAQNPKCDYKSGLLEPFLAASENLYCFDDQGASHSVTDDARLCSEVDRFSARSDGMDVLCANDFTLVGYTFYPCEDGVLASGLSDDKILRQYSACVPADSPNVCKGVDSAADGSKLKVDQAVGKVLNVDLVAGDETDPVAYAMACDAGFDFQADVTKRVYGYCSANGDAGNEFTLTGADGCHELCSPENTNLDGVSLTLDEGSRHGASVNAGVECPDGFDIATSAPRKYPFACNGKLAVDQGAANAGVFNCEEADCPKCLPQCPENPSLDDITNAGEIVNLKGVEDTAAAPSGLTVLVGVTCNEGFSLAEGAEDKYDLQCNSVVENVVEDVPEDDIEVVVDDDNGNNVEAPETPEAPKPNSGKWTFVNDLPVCHPVCPKEAVAAIDNVETVTMIEDGIEGQTVQGVIICAGGYALEDDDAMFDFTCSNGQFVAAGDGPQCQRECTIPEDDETFNFFHKDKPLEGGAIIRPGKSHVKLQCKDENLQLVGTTTMSCNKEGEMVFDDETEPFCADTIVCSAPVVVAGKLNTKNNVEIGKVFTVECDTSHWFSAATVQKYNPGDLSVKGYSVAEIECEGKPLEALTCHQGCLPPTIDGGKVFPDMAMEDSAPYEIGQVVKYECLDGAKLTEGKAEATCQVGGLGSAVCGACSFALSLVLAFMVLLTLL